jgi:hypothetical protein
MVHRVITALQMINFIKPSLLQQNINSSSYLKFPGKCIIFHKSMHSRDFVKSKTVIAVRRAHEEQEISAFKGLWPYS